MAALTEQILKCYRPLLEEKEIVLCVGGTLEIQGEAALMKRVLENLIGNAVKFTPEKKSIEIVMAGREYRITNTGAFIERGRLSEIWEPYVKADSSRSSQGSGIGLSIVKEIMDAHGFFCAAESNGEQVSFVLRFRWKYKKLTLTAKNVIINNCAM